MFFHYSVERDERKKSWGGGGSALSPLCLASGRFFFSSLFLLRPQCALFLSLSLSLHPLSYLLDLGVRAGVDGRGADGDDGAAGDGDGLLNLSFFFRFFDVSEQTKDMKIKRENGRGRTDAFARSLRVITA